MNEIIGRPEADELAPDFVKSVNLVSGNDILTQLDRQLETTLSFLKGITEEHSLYRYAPEKWSIREVLGHLIDAERIMAYRALRFSRGDRTPVPGFEQDDYVKLASSDDRSLQDLTAEFEFVRKANACMFRSLSAEAWQRKGVASGNEVSVRALAYIIAGHELHHLGVLRSCYA